MRGRLHRLAAHASQLLRSTSFTSYYCGVLKAAAYPFPSGGSLAGFSGWAPREYPFKPPLKRIKVGKLSNFNATEYCANPQVL